MASTYSTLKIELIGTGEQAGLWGTTTNTNLGTALEEAIVGSADVTFSSADVTLTLTDTNATQIARHLRLNLTGTSGGARNLVLGSGCQIDKPYLINNGLADTVTVKNTTGTGIAVPAGKTMWVYNNGTNVVDAVTHLSSLTLGSALPIASGGTGTTSTTFVNLTTNVTGTLPASNGGTGITSLGTGVATWLGTPSSANLAAAVTDETGSGALVFATSPTLTTPNLGTPSTLVLTNATGLPLSTGVTGDLPFANLTQIAGLSVLGVTGNATADVAGITAGTDNQVLRRSGTSVAFGAVNLASSDAVTGALTVTNGGTGGTSQSTARTGLGATTLGANLFTITNPSAITFPRFNADNTVSSLSAADFRTAIGAGTGGGTVTSVGGTGTVNGITLTGTVTSSGNLTLGGTLSGVSLSTQVTGTLPIANGGSGQTTAQAAMNAFAGAVTSGSYLRGNGTNVVMSTIQAGDVPTLNQNTTGSAATLTTARTIQTNLASTSAASFNGSANVTPGVTGTLPVANGGLGLTSIPGLSIPVANSANTYTTVTPAAGQSIRINAGGSAWEAYTPGGGGGSGTVTSVAFSTGTTGLSVTGSPITTSGTITLAGTLAVANGGTGVTTSTGSGSVVLSTSPTLTTPVLGTPTSGTLSNCTVDGTDAVGFRNTPINSQSAAYTLVLADAGKTVLHPISDNNARTFTIPANSSVAYPVGTVITFVNLINTVTIAITSDTMYLAGVGTTGSRTLAAYGVATAVKLTSTSWLISGNGLT